MVDSTFPLYDVIISKVNKLIKDDPEKSDITIPEVREVIDCVYKMDKISLDSVYVLIRIHSLRNEGLNSPFNIPYSGKVAEQSSTEEKQNIVFDIRHFPPILRRILLEFVRMYKTIKKEDRV